MKAEQTSAFPSLRSVSLGFSHKLMTSEDDHLLQEAATVI